jgi:hypothetical protein
MAPEGGQGKQGRRLRIGNGVHPSSVISNKNTSERAMVDQTTDLSEIVTQAKDRAILEVELPLPIDGIVHGLLFDEGPEVELELCREGLEDELSGVGDEGGPVLGRVGVDMAAGLMSCRENREGGGKERRKEKKNRMFSTSGKEKKQSSLGGEEKVDESNVRQG